jgi:uncharacterized coiled-coil protein SlyX
MVIRLEVHMPGEDLEARVAKLETDLPWYQGELLNFTSSIEGAEARLILRTSELERRITRLERSNRFVAEVVTGILAALVAASVAYWIQGDTSPWGVMAILGFFVAVVLTHLYFRWIAPE